MNRTQKGEGRWRGILSTQQPTQKKAKQNAKAKGKAKAKMKGFLD